jgi:hypothetical protein
VLHGPLDSIARGITDRDAGTGRVLLADVNPTFNWVRLAQRVPVRITLDDVPKNLTLVAGTTCTVSILGGLRAAALTRPTPPHAPGTADHGPHRRAGLRGQPRVTRHARDVKKPAVAGCSHGEVCVSA